MSYAAEVQAEAQRLRKVFLTKGATLVETDVLQPAETLLDLYGEDIRARAFVTDDPSRGEMMLRPDFTVPVVQLHLASGSAEARYAYSGSVFRQQPAGSDRASEYVQVGYEIFGGSDPAAADAELFALFSQVLEPTGAQAATGDIGLFRAAVMGLSTTDVRKAALLRHLWRPVRFRALLERFGGQRALAEDRLALLSADNPIADGLEMPGLRSRAEVEARLATLRADLAEAPIAKTEVDALWRLLDLKGDCLSALDALRKLQNDLPNLAQAVDRFEARLDALEIQGIQTDTLAFEASFGRTTLEYYDGFVFGFSAPGGHDVPPVATGGRYDALTKVLSRGAGTRAVGGVIRPELTLAMGGTI